MKKINNETKEWKNIEEVVKKICKIKKIIEEMIIEEEIIEDDKKNEWSYRK